METIWTLLFLEGNSFKGRGGEGEVGSAPPPPFPGQLLEWAFILKVFVVVGNPL